MPRMSHTTWCTQGSPARTEAHPWENSLLLPSRRLPCGDDSDTISSLGSWGRLPPQGTEYQARAPFGHLCHTEIHLPRYQFHALFNNGIFSQHIPVVFQMSMAFHRHFGQQMRRLFPGERLFLSVWPCRITCKTPEEGPAESKNGHWKRLFVHLLDLLPSHPGVAFSFIWGYKSRNLSAGGCSWCLELYMHQLGRQLGLFSAPCANSL